MRKLFNATFGGLLLIFALASCSNEEKYNTIPYKKVDFIFYPTDPSIAAFGGLKKFAGGYNNNGVYVCNISAVNPVFLAFDATCPLEPDHKTAVYPLENSLLVLKCSKCGTTYDLRSQGIGGNTRLQRYPVHVQGFGTYYKVINY